MYYSSSLGMGIKRTVLLWPVAFKAHISRKLPADVRFVSIQELGDMISIVFEIRNVADLISFNLIELLIVRGQLRLASQEA